MVCMDLCSFSCLPTTDQQVYFTSLGLEKSFFW
nr:MAG TPA: hypothetical protein [Caudoviricetes sp.]